MAVVSLSSRNSKFVPSLSERDSSFRQLKNRLQARFPYVQSSHMSEAIAAGLGFSTNAALRATLSDPKSWQFEFETLDTKRFYHRLLGLGYPLQADLNSGPRAASIAPPAHYVEWLRQLNELERSPDKVWGRIYELRELCANEFAKFFQVGHLERADDKQVVQRWKIGVDHGSCLPNWGAKLNNGVSVDFPGADHVVCFYESLPLAKGKVAEYQRAVVSMPYANKQGAPSHFGEAAHLAGCLGWTCTFHNEWSWYAPGSTALVLFTRSTPHETILQAWHYSFQRWLLENRNELDKSVSQIRKFVVADTIHCSHLPWDLKSFEDCRQRYLKEFAPGLYHGHDDEMAQALERLMDKWLTDWDWHAEVA